VQKHPYEM